MSLLRETLELLSTEEKEKWEALRDERDDCQNKIDAALLAQADMLRGIIDRALKGRWRIVVRDRSIAFRPRDPAMEFQLSKYLRAFREFDPNGNQHILLGKRSPDTKFLHLLVDNGQVILITLTKDPLRATEQIAAFDIEVDLAEWVAEHSEAYITDLEAEQAKTRAEHARLQLKIDQFRAMQGKYKDDI